MELRIRRRGRSKLRFLHMIPAAVKFVCPQHGHAPGRLVVTANPGRTVQGHPGTVVRRAQSVLSHVAGNQDSELAKLVAGPGTMHQALSVVQQDGRDAKQLVPASPLARYVFIALMGSLREQASISERQRRRPLHHRRYFNIIQSL